MGNISDFDKVQLLSCKSFIVLGIYNFACCKLSVDYGNTGYGVSCQGIQKYPKEIIEF